MGSETSRFTTPLLFSLLYERGIWVTFFVPFLAGTLCRWDISWFVSSFCIKSAINHVFVLYQPSLFFITLFHSLDTKTRIFNSHLKYKIAIQSTWLHLLGPLYHLLVPIRRTLDIISRQIDVLYVTHSLPASLAHN
ncbi:hypothetical protein V8C43DRAFT_262535 [Trichoderma afarasin]